MYRHRPYSPALVGALMILILGWFTACFIYERVLEGEADIRTLLFVGMLTVVLTGSLIIVAFSRYRFMHLWRNTGARHSNKYKGV